MIVKSRTNLVITSTGLIAVLPVFFYIGNFVKMYTGNLSINYIIMSSVGVIGLLLMFTRSLNYLKQFKIFSILYIVCFVLQCIVIRNYQISTMPSMLYHIGITWIMLTYRWSEKQGAFGFYLVFILISIRLLRFSSSRVLSISSNNYISILLILMCVLYYAPFEWNKKKFTAIHTAPAILTFALSVIAGGRGGVLSSGVLMVGIVIRFVFRKTGRKSYRVIIIILLVLLLIAAVIFSDSFMTRILRMSSFRDEGFESAIRLSMWSQYLQNMLSSLKNALFGVPLKNIPLIVRFSGNPHNSFIRLHATSGILPFLMLLYYLIQATLKYIKQKRSMALLLLTVLVIRGMTDAFIFGRYGTPDFLFLVLYPYTAGFVPNTGIIDNQSENDMNGLLPEVNG